MDAILTELLERFRRGERRALARLLSLAARGECLGNILRALRATPAASKKNCLVAALTGSAGVGKSTLVGRLIEYLRKEKKTVAVLACDPQSPLTGGALLGDRFRMPGEPDDGVFIRSVASAGGHGAVAEHVAAMIALLEHYGFDVVLIETVGAGQGDTAVRQLADVVVLLLQPETGDDLQWEKAGVLEVSDVIVIHKADLPGADNVEAQVRAMLDLSPVRQVPVVRVSAKNRSGLAELWQAVEQAARDSQRHTEPARELLDQVLHLLSSRFEHADAGALQPLVAAWQRGEMDDATATRQLVELLVRDAKPPAS
ncbi:MAG: ArgK/MeaB family GTPase [Gemmataceae bacterium]